jgi:hypothetical protein
VGAWRFARCDHARCTVEPTLDARARLTTRRTEPQIKLR